MLETTDLETWRRILKTDLASHAYTAEQEDWPGVAVFTNQHDDFFNLAVLQQSQADQADRLLKRIVTHYQTRGLTPRVRITPLSTPTDWRERLITFGFVEAEGEEVFMRLDGPLKASANPAVTVLHAPTEVSFSEFVNLQALGFGMAIQGDAWVERAYAARTRWDYLFLVAYVDGQPAGAATARFEDRVCGVYGVSTIEAFRRRGVSTTLLHTILAEADQRACDLVFLSADPKGYARQLYAKLGFIEVFHTYNYELKSP